MSEVIDCVTCKQCGYAYADYIYNCRDSSRWLSCSRCGYRYESGPVYDPETHNIVLDGDGKWVWKTTEARGYGALCYQMRGAVGFCVHSLSEDPALRLKAEVEVAVNAGEFEAEPFYLSRWNEESRHVELILGKFPPLPVLEKYEQEPSEVKCADSGDWSLTDDLPF